MLTGVKRKSMWSNETPRSSVLSTSRTWLVSSDFHPPVSQAVEI